MPTMVNHVEWLYAVCECRDTDNSMVSQGVHCNIGCLKRVYADDVSCVRSQVASIVKRVVWIPCVCIPYTPNLIRLHKGEA